MFKNTVEGLEAGGAKLEHVQFVSGEESCDASQSVANAPCDAKDMLTT